MSRVSYSLALLASLALAGCSQAPVPEDQFYRFSVPPPATRFAVPPLESGLVIERFAAQGLLSERAVIFATQDNPDTLRRYHYHFWVDSPTRMLQELLAAFLRSQNTAPWVATPAMRLKPGYILTGKIQRLEHLRGRTHQAVVQLEFGLYRTADGQLALLRSYTEKTHAGDGSVRGAVDGFNDALTRIFARLSSDIAAAQEAASD